MNIQFIQLIRLFINLELIKLPGWGICTLWNSTGTN